ncbi:hypothetical protein LG200_05110 [Methylobacillus caricis]|uniref:hypothetical protein n=1 Tax=Methylobacillus caricis TaxID=1971611 RepID=UPI001CFF7EB1|nr:hypothetical protein [Methylobacillus caricis]MCB5187383.1 hypothetical protein [Methylobacillus caricis]
MNQDINLGRGGSFVIDGSGKRELQQETRPANAAPAAPQQPVKPQAPVKQRKGKSTISS